MRILFVKTSSLGDVIHNLPAVTDIHMRFPEARIDWVVEESFAAIPYLHPAINRVIPIAIRRWRRNLLSLSTWREIASFNKALRADKYDYVIDTQGLIKSGLITWRAQSQTGHQKWGLASASAREPWAAYFYDKTVNVPKNLHAVTRNRQLAAAALGYSLNDSLKETVQSPVDYGIAAQPLLNTINTNWLPASPYVVFLTATSRTDKMWPAAHWIALGTALAQQGLTCILPAGSPDERTYAAQLVHAIPNAQLAPRLDLGTLAGLLAGAQAIIGVDTGLSHLAAALDRPVVALFSASHPDLTGVYAGVHAVNLGGMHTPPTVDAVLNTLTTLMTFK